MNRLATSILALIFQTQRWPFPFTHPNAYGIFPNPNHMSNWLSVAGILLAGTLYADIRKKYFVPAGISRSVLVTTGTGYSFVYHLEICLLLATLIVIGPMVRLTGCPRGPARSRRAAR